MLIFLSKDVNLHSGFQNLLKKIAPIAQLVRATDS